MAMLPATETYTRRRRVLRFFGTTPKGQLVLIFSALVAIAAPTAGDPAAVALHLLAPITAAWLLDLALDRGRAGRWHVPTGAPLTGAIVAMILAVDTAWYVAVLASVAAIASKHILRVGREHVLNPAAFGLLVTALVLGSPESWWGALGDVHVAWTLVMLVAGGMLVERLNKLPLVLTFGAAYFGLWTGIAFVNPTIAAEAFRPPFTESVAFLALFMLTDPPTSPIRPGDQVLFGLLAGVSTCAAWIFGAGQTFLLIGVLTANLWLGWDRLAPRIERRLASTSSSG
jgi:Na+-transporting NADH:ubiquinone oxidoreductase subunit NqrB